MKRKRFSRVSFFSGGLLTLLFVTVGIVHFYVIPKTEETVRALLQASGYPNATVKISAAPVLYLTVTVFENAGGPPTAYLEVWPWSLSRLRLAKLHFYALPLPVFSEEKENGAVSSPWWQKKFFVPRLPYHEISVDDLSISLKQDQDIALSASGLMAWDASTRAWRTNLSFLSTYYEAAGDTLLVFKEDGSYFSTFTVQHRQGSRDAENMQLSFAGGQDKPILKGEILSPLIKAKINESEEAGLARIPLVGTLKPPLSQAGALTLSGMINLEKRTANINLSGDFIHPHATINGLHAALSIPIQWPLQLETPQSFQAKTVLASGFPLTDVTGRFTYEDNTLNILSLSGQTLGGSVAIEKTRIKIPFKEIKTNVQLNHIELAQGLALAGVDGLDGEGTLSGILPISYANGKIQFDEGGLTALKAGTITYAPTNPPAFLQEGGQARMLADIFRDFRFKTLSMTLNGIPGAEKSDTLTLGARIEGYNPSFYDGHPVSFNLTLSGDLDTVLQQGLKGLSLNPDGLRELVKMGEKQ